MGDRGQQYQCVVISSPYMGTLTQRRVSFPTSVIKEGWFYLEGYHRYNSDITEYNMLSTKIMLEENQHSVLSVDNYLFAYHISSIVFRISIKSIHDILCYQSTTFPISLATR